MRWLLTTAALLVGCANEVPHAPKDRRQFLDQVTVKCDLPTSIFVIVAGEQVTFRPPADANYDDVDCALREVKKSPFKIDLGFVGNEAFRED